ncbi:acyl-CoA dehydrogenase family protein [Mycobacterium sp. CVI_P3]|uniref:Acyl-CoA dehydrogenase family protein n=1 Tax=Mycobacterium pinniadriaticum TaxID=2994102 RepID=A0ABT3S9T2_9MYCO|nr:acyl-CoA dehydrogenase family protein [Mycobacterium pinniadriaticum]MCX2930108.1 acyl-CoA dehydrogenase family protein [Mycobacterium pinniadriaticum]MCX2936243.1 acyl-CoA dehydrogenase family protein [Mycobacterium pinniadriaticum]
MTTLARRSDHSADHVAFRESARRFVANDVVPHLDDWRRDGAVARAVFTAAGSHGFLGTCAPDEFGGGDVGDYGFLAILIEETVDAGSIGLALLWALHAGVALPQLLDHGTPEIRQELAPGLVAGDIIAAVAGGMDGHAVLGAKLADIVLMAADDEVTLLPVGAAGAGAVPLPASLAAAEAGSADLEISDAGTPTPLSGAGESFGRDVDLWIAVVAVAAARQSMNLAVHYAESRRVFGKPLAEFENTQMRLGEIAADIRMVTTYVDHCIAARSSSVLDTTDAAAAREVAVRLAGRAADQSLQLHGGYGYMREYPIAQTFADTRYLATAAQQFSDARRVMAAELFSAR